MCLIFALIRLLINKQTEKIVNYFFNSTNAEVEVYLGARIIILGLTVLADLFKKGETKKGVT